jgi:hypothetical protein
MSTSFRQAYGSLLAQLVQDKCTYRQMVRMTLLLALAELALWLFPGRPGVRPGQLMVMLSLPWTALQIWTGAFLRLAIRQNRPEYACLVPQLRSRLIRLAAAWYVGNALLLSGMSWLAFGHAGYGLMLAGIGSVFMIWMNRFVSLAWVMAVGLPFGAKFLVDDLFPKLSSISEAQMTLVVMPVVVLLCGWGLQLILPSGGDRHWAWQQAFNQRRDAFAGPAARAPTTQPPSRFSQLRQRFYVAALHRDSRPGVTADRAMMHVVGPGAHPGYVLAYSLGSTALALLIVFLVGRADVGAGVLSVVGLAQLSAVLMYALRVANDVVLHGAEQQLYFLTPAAPAAVHINRLLTATVLWRALLVWLVSLACAAVIDSTLAGHPTLRGASFALAMGVLWTLTPLLRNHAVVPPRIRNLEWTVIIVLVVLVCLGAVVTARVTPNFPWYGLGAVAGISAVVRLALRWRALMALPPVLPAGRLAV